VQIEALAAEHRGAPLLSTGTAPDPAAAAAACGWDGDDDVDDEAGEEGPSQLEAEEPAGGEAASDDEDQFAVDDFDEQSFVCAGSSFTGAAEQAADDGAQQPSGRDGGAARADGGAALEGPHSAPVGVPLAPRAQHAAGAHGSSGEDTFGSWQETGYLMDRVARDASSHAGCASCGTSSHAGVDSPRPAVAEEVYDSVGSPLMNIGNPVTGFARACQDAETAVGTVVQPEQSSTIEPGRRSSSIGRAVVAAGWEVVDRSRTASRDVDPSALGAV
jgi:hypothetical protein